MSRAPAVSVTVSDIIYSVATPATDYAVPLLSPVGHSNVAAVHSTGVHPLDAAYTAATANSSSGPTACTQPLSAPMAAGLTFPSALSASISSLSKAELIEQLQQARREAAREAEEARLREENSRRLALEAELSALSLQVAQKKDVPAMHAQAASELAAQQSSHAALQDEIQRLQELIELEVARKESMRAAAVMEVQALRVKLEQERLEQERKARLLAAQIAAVKMEIQDRSAKYRARKQADLHRRAVVEEKKAAEEAHNAQEQEMAALKRQRDAMERELATHTAAPHGVLKSFTLDQQASSSLSWPGSPANPWLEPEPCIRHVLRVDSEFNIVAQPDHRRVRLKQHPFAKGGLRLAYFCEDITQPAAPFRLVAKESVYVGAKANSLSNFYNDVRCQLVARTFAQRFNQLNPPKLIQFLLPMIYEFPMRADPDRRYMAVEVFLDGRYGRYVKYSDNQAYVNAEYRTIPAFCHWSAQSSAGQMMITDLQGVHYILTDPVVHSKHPSADFGLGGGDEQAMLDFFRAHRCNEICQAFGLQQHAAQPTDKDAHGGRDEGQTRANTQYASEVMGECGHVFVVQSNQRAEWIGSKGRMLCPDCRNTPNAVPFFPPER